MGKQNEKQGTYDRTFLASRAWASRLTWETLRKERFHVFRGKPTHPKVNQNFFPTCVQTHTDAKLAIYTVETGLYVLSSLHLKHTEV